MRIAKYLAIILLVISISFGLVRMDLIDASFLQYIPAIIGIIIAVYLFTWKKDHSEKKE